jgi:hypothetical protein
MKARAIKRSLAVLFGLGATVLAGAAPSAQHAADKAKFQEWSESIEIDLAFDCKLARAVVCDVRAQRAMVHAFDSQGRLVARQSIARASGQQVVVVSATTKMRRLRFDLGSTGSLQTLVVLPHASIDSALSAAQPFQEKTRAEREQGMDRKHRLANPKKSALSAAQDGVQRRDAMPRVVTSAKKKASFASEIEDRDARRKKDGQLQGLTPLPSSSISKADIRGTAQHGSAWGPGASNAGAVFGGNASVSAAAGSFQTLAPGGLDPTAASGSTVQVSSGQAPGLVPTSAGGSSQPAGDSGLSPVSSTGSWTIPGLRWLPAGGSSTPAGGSGLSPTQANGLALLFVVLPQPTSSMSFYQ